MDLFAGEISGAVVCPSCHVMCRPSSIIENHFLAESVALAALGDLEAAGDTARQCGSCPDTAATSWCVDCAEFICDGCVQVSSLSNSMLHFALNYITKPTLAWYMLSICSTTNYSSSVFDFPIWQIRPLLHHNILPLIHWRKGKQ